MFIIVMLINLHSITLIKSKLILLHRKVKQLLNILKLYTFALRVSSSVSKIALNIAYCTESE